MAKRRIITTPIPDLQTLWNGTDLQGEYSYSGGKIEEFIKSYLGRVDSVTLGKVGYVIIDGVNEEADGEALREIGLYKILGFKDQEDSLIWKDPETGYNPTRHENVNKQDLILFEQILPIKEHTGSDYFSYLTTTLSPGQTYVVATREFQVPLRAEAISKDRAGTEETHPTDHQTLVIQKSTDGGNTWVTLDTFSVMSRDYIKPSELEPSDYHQEDTIDLGSYLSEGSQEIRMRVSYQIYDSGTVIGQATSSWVTFSNIIYTNLQVSFSDTSSAATIIDTSSASFDDTFPVSLNLHGATVKKVWVTIKNPSGTTVASTNVEVSAQTTSWSHDFTLTGGFTHGVYSVAAWLTCTDGITQDAIQSPIVATQRMVIDEDTAGGNLYKPYLMLQGVQTDVTNYTEVDPFLEYAVWIPSSSNPHTPSSETIGLDFIVSSGSDTQDMGTEYMRMEVAGRASSTLYSLNGVVIEAESAASSLTGYLHILGIYQGVTSDILDFSSGSEFLPISIDNESHFQPTPKAVFFMNPKTRNNSEIDPKQIYNEANNHATVESHFYGFSAISDLWITSSSDHQHVLRVLAGQSLTINYDWLSGLQNLSGTDNTSVSFEVDFKTSNVTNENLPIFQAGAALDNKYIGISLKPMTGSVCSRNYYNEGSQNFHWQEDTRTHLVVNIISRYDLKGNKLPICRIFINGVMVREFLFGTRNEGTGLWEYNSNEWYNDLVPSTITIGQVGADIDIYAIRIYSTKGGSKFLDSSDILQNYISQLPTSSEKLAVKQENDIIDPTTELVSFESVRNLKKNCLIWHGRQPRHPSAKDPAYDETKLPDHPDNLNTLGPTDGTNGYWEILLYKSNGTLDKDHSGTICKQTGATHEYGLTPSRQGTTANSYFYSNIQTKLKDVEKSAKTALQHELWERTSGAKGKECTDPEKLAESRNYCVTVLVSKIAPDFSYDSDMVYYDPTLNGNVILVADGWFDSNVQEGDISGLGLYHGPYWRISDDAPLAQKLVLKINYASSMQSHLEGACKLYNDLHTAIVGKNTMQTADSKAKVAKPQEAFYYFTKESEAGTATFQGLGTFGPGKMDDPTWGYVKKTHKNFVMFEGADNNNPLTDFRVPWDSSRIVENAYDKEGKLKDDVQSLDYNGKRNFDLDRFTFIDKDETYGRTIEVAGESIEAPSTVVLGIMKEVVNFLYLHNPMIKGYSGTWSSFLSSSHATSETEYLWWCTLDDQQGSGVGAWELMRYDEIDEAWVPAGWDAVNEETEVRDLATEFSDIYNNRASKTPDNISSEIIQAIVQDAKDNFGNYFKTQSAIFHYAFVNSFIAGTDNCSKNTYYVIDPTTNKIELHQDDMDTIFATDNLGHQTKPYYIDRVNPYSDEDIHQVNSLYEGKNNVLFNLIELMYGDSGVGQGEIKAMTGQIFTEMINLVSGDTRHENSLWGCLQKYFFDIQDYFSATAYNETAKIRYEYPTVIGFVDTIRGSVPITQSVGDQLDAEKQYMKRRLVLYTSYAGWGPFGITTGGGSSIIGIPEADTGSLTFTSCANDSGERPAYIFHLTPHQYIYPTGQEGSSLIELGQRCKPGVEVIFTLSNNGDTGRALNGSNYYRGIGNIGDFCISPTHNPQLQITGKRLTEIHIEPSDTESPNFRAASLVINAPQAEVFTIHGCSQTAGDLNLSGCVRLGSIDLIGSSISNVRYPETQTLTTIHNPETLTSTYISNLPGLTSLSFEGYAGITNLEWHLTGSSGEFNSLTQIRNLRSASAKLSRVILTGVNWTSAIGRALDNANITDYLASATLSRVEGTIQMTGNYMTFNRKNQYSELWGNIDDAYNGHNLHITYPRNNVTDHIKLSGREYIFPISASESRGGVEIPATTYKYLSVPYTDQDEMSTQSNDILGVTWSYSGYGAGNGNYIEETTGILHANYTSTDPESNPHVGTVTATATLYGGATKTATYEVKFNKKAPSIGDYIYADGSWSSHFETDRTVVGICYYINQDAPLERLCVSPKSLGSWYWGLYNTSEYMSGITLDETAPSGYAIYDLADLQDIQGYPLVACDPSEKASDETSDSRYYIRESNFLSNGDFKYDDILETYSKATKASNETAPKMFGYVNTSEALQDNESYPSIWSTGGIIPQDRRVPLGFLETLYTIKHRNTILTHAVSRAQPYTLPDGSAGTYQENISNDGLVIPTASSGKTEWQHLTELLQLAVEKNQNITHYRELYYPAASKAYAFSPELDDVGNSYNMKPGETLNRMFKAHNWFLPCIGDLMRMYWYHRCSTGGISGATYTQAAASSNPEAIFAKAYFEMGTTGGTRNFTVFPASYHWSSTELGSYNSWYVNFSSGFANGSIKCDGFVVRPVAAF